MDKATLEAIIRSDMPADVKAALIIQQGGLASQAQQVRQQQPGEPAGGFDTDNIKLGMSKEEQATYAREIERVMNEG
ncbi:hypothetical protein [uncultured Paludibaculum sp.]|uniref:hypothetical protein n=1 Tax=uncultured Paludibaculum sp. TaxID=1765020 RepID=UPI002AAAB7E8|nr:hypothetical protein [uncultured Paludibaculum sp.]